MIFAWHAELLKIATVRGQWISAVLATAVVPLSSFLVVVTGGLSSSGSVVTGAASGALVGIVAFGAWAATITASEYAHDTMLVTLATVPRRLVLYGVKLMAVATVAATGAIVSAAGALVIVRALVGGGHRLGNPAALGGIVLAVVVVSVIGAGMGIMTRSPSASTRSCSPSSSSRMPPPGFSEGCNGGSWVRAPAPWWPRSSAGCGFHRARCSRWGHGQRQRRWCCWRQSSPPEVLWCSSDTTGK